MQIIFYSVRARAICPTLEPRVRRAGPKILYLIAVSRAPALPAGMLLVKSHQNGVKTIYILPYVAAFLVGAVRVIRGWSLIHGLHSPTCYDRGPVVLAPSISRDPFLSDPDSLSVPDVIVHGATPFVFSHRSMGASERSGMKVYDKRITARVTDAGRARARLSEHPRAIDLKNHSPFPLSSRIIVMSLYDPAVNRIES